MIEVLYPNLSKSDIRNDENGIANYYVCVLQL